MSVGPPPKTPPGGGGGAGFGAADKLRVRHRLTRGVWSAVSYNTELLLHKLVERVWALVHVNVRKNCSSARIVLALEMTLICRHSCKSKLPQEEEEEEEGPVSERWAIFESKAVSYTELLLHKLSERVFGEDQPPPSMIAGPGEDFPWARAVTSLAAQVTALARKSASKVVHSTGPGVLPLEDVEQGADGTRTNPKILAAESREKPSSASSSSRKGGPVRKGSSSSSRREGSSGVFKDILENVLEKFLQQTAKVLLASGLHQEDWAKSSPGQTNPGPTNSRFSALLPSNHPARTGTVPAML